MKFNLDGFNAYVITEEKDSCVISNGQGYVMEAEQMIDVAKKMIKFAIHHKKELRQHNIKRSKEYEQEISTLNTTPKEKEKAYVYLLKCGDYYKIGFSKDVERRIKELDHRPYKVEIIYISPLTNRAYQIEQNLHSELEQYRINGEWYDLPKRLIDAICDVIKIEAE